MTEADVTYTVLVDDNFHYRDESERFKDSEHKTYEAALARAKALVEEKVEQLRQETPDASPAKLYTQYHFFGEDPYIIPPGEPRFSAWDYAKELCGLRDAE
jgi:hypothetical protein